MGKKKRTLSLMASTEGEITNKKFYIKFITFTIDNKMYLILVHLFIFLAVYFLV